MIGGAWEANSFLQREASFKQLQQEFAKKGRSGRNPINERCRFVLAAYLSSLGLETYPTCLMERYRDRSRRTPQAKAINAKEVSRHRSRDGGFPLSNIRNVRIAVPDYGLGVPDKSQDQVFEPFFRVDEARNSDSGGVGLGLSIMKLVVHVRHGTVAARNANPGLRVEIKLPR